MGKLFRLPSCLLLVILVLACRPTTNHKEESISIIPQPQQLELFKGAFKLNSETGMYAEAEFSTAANFLKTYLLKGAGIDLKNSPVQNASIVFEKNDALPAEGYELDITKDKVHIGARDASGAFYAVQSIRQLLPPQLEQLNSLPKKSVEIPLVRITDFPRFSYRGMHLDVGRHFFPKEFIKKYISYLAMLKMNYFHWHLTEDQGWRIEIKKYPKLMSKAAFRDETLIGHYNDTPQKFDGQRYGGYYTQEDIKEIVAFAAKHQITIIPEIEMPGHAQAAISAYPVLGCTGTQIPVATSWGVFEPIYCPKEETFEFLEDVLTEVMALFPGEYIHIGGDEAPKIHWKSCAACKKRIAEEGLKDEHELQSYFVKRIESFVNSKGKKIIGWDEILEGGLAPNATVMSWRGIQGGIEAAKSKHHVIMTPTSHSYFDYYQSDDPGEPLAIGGYLPLKKVFGFNPIPEDLNKEEAQYILGAQGNLWTEYIKTEQQVEYMIFPRILAMSELTWSGPTKDIEKAYPGFVNRVEHFHERLNALGVNYANHLYIVEGAVEKSDNSVYYTLKTPTSDKEIRYSINGGNWNSFASRIKLTEDTELKALVFSKGMKLGDTFTESIRYHKGILSDLALNVEPHPSYAAGGVAALNNGILGSNSRYGDSEWLGFWGDDLEIEIDLGTITDIDKIVTRFYHAPGQWIHAPKVVHVSGTLDNSKHFTTSVSTFEPSESHLRPIEIDLSNLNLNRFEKLKLSIPNFGLIPMGEQGAGNKAWTFIDEIIIQ